MGVRGQGIRRCVGSSKRRSMCRHSLVAAFAAATVSCRSDDSRADTSHERTVVLTNVAVSEDMAATFAQVHLLPGETVLSTSSTARLLACPGGWNGLAVTSGPGAWGRQ
jgi:hypothetical protein